jgi:hypothetical protein
MGFFFFFSLGFNDLNYFVGLGIMIVDVLTDLFLSLLSYLYRFVLVILGFPSNLLGECFFCT